MTRPGCVGSTMMSILAGVVIGVAAFFVATLFLCHGYAQLRVGVLAFVVGSAIVFFILHRGIGRAVLLAIVLILPPAVALPGLESAADNGRQKETIKDIETIGLAIETFKATNGRLPTANELDRLPIPRRDGWRNRFLVRVTPASYEVRSLGACGRADGPSESDRFEEDLVYRDGAWVKRPEL